MYFKTQQTNAIFISFKSRRLPGGTPNQGRYNHDEVKKDE